MKNAWYVFFLLLTTTGTIFSQGIRSLENFRTQYDGSEVFLHNGELPKIVSDEMEESVGQLILVGREACGKTKCPNEAISGGVVSVVGDHLVMANLHIFNVDSYEWVNGMWTNKPQPELYHFKVWLLFGGVFYEGHPERKSIIKGIDLVLITVRDRPDRKFGAPPRTFNKERLVPGVSKFYLLGFYDGCEDRKNFKQNTLCTTPGLMVLRVFKGYSSKPFLGSKNLGSLVGLTTFGFSGALIFGERGECFGVVEGIVLPNFRTYFIPGFMAARVVERFASLPAHR